MIRYLILLYSKDSDALTFHRRICSQTADKDQKKKIIETNLTFVLAIAADIYNVYYKKINYSIPMS